MDTNEYEWKTPLVGFVGASLADAHDVQTTGAGKQRPYR